MKKDIFNGKVKREYISYIWFTIILVIGIFVGGGSLLLYSAFQHESGTVDRNGLIFLGILHCLIGALYFLITIIYIRNYPKYPKLGKFCFNSDVYFVGSDSKEYRGHWRGRPVFNMITHVVEQNKDLENIKYPTKYKICFALCILGIVMLFVNIFGCFVLMENVSLLPQNLQNEGIIFTAFIVLEMIDLVFSFLFAFQVKNIRKATIDEYRKSQMK